MAKKDELIEKAKGLEIELDSNETVADLEAKIAAAEAEAGGSLPVAGELVRRRVNRGSSRRIERALTAFQKACDEFAKEMDIQLFVADGNGERIAPWPGVEGISNIKEGVTQEINEILHPPRSKDD